MKKASQISMMIVVSVASSFPGGALVGCAAGFMNAPRLKAIHSAIRSGKAAAESITGALAAGRETVQVARAAARKGRACT